ncbi:hypothetical protein IW262DRAFT_1512170 [Armillaria fumosa]|nr:hypothetical protein IW262DRAFT_1299991 [Armillaria fumosa]KAK0215780.1 hypothetical protein IW262DRAFT_1299994 [Armillaria fumosa]KAK0215783.1 hypothetical protein IW262DRAFT_1512162 [Armillaria fumosa]KAK0215786.1 hypothetical protein IW262DRAFT_1512170 [Armillaria fumosa]
MPATFFTISSCVHPKSSLSRGNLARVATELESMMEHTAPFAEGKIHETPAFEQSNFPPLSSLYTSISSPSLPSLSPMTSTRVSVIITSAVTVFFSPHHHVNIDNDNEHKDSPCAPILLPFVVRMMLFVLSSKESVLFVLLKAWVDSDWSSDFLTVPRYVTEKESCLSLMTPIPQRSFRTSTRASTTGWTTTSNKGQAAVAWDRMGRKSAALGGDGDDRSRSTIKGHLSLKKRSHAFVPVLTMVVTLIWVAGQRDTSEARSLLLARGCRTHSVLPRSQTLNGKEGVASSGNMLTSSRVLASSPQAAKTTGEMTLWWV